MNNNLPKRSANQARWLISAAFITLFIFLLAPAVQAQIAIQDGNPLAAIASLGGGPTVNKPFTVTPGAGVLVVMVEDRQAATVIPEPATITWNGTNILTLDTNSFANSSNYRSMAMYHLFNPPPGTGNITVTYSIGNNTILVAAYTLNGVDTNTAPQILQASTVGGTSLSGAATNVVAGSWAAVGSIWGTTGGTLTTTGDGGTATMVVNNNVGGSEANAGYVANLNAGIVNVGVTVSGSTKGCFIAEIFTPGAPTPANVILQPQSLIVFTNQTVGFGVTASGAPPLYYQWYINDTSSPLANGGGFAGVTNSTLTISNASVANVGNYFVVVTNVNGASTSSVANLAFTSPSGAYESAVLSNSPFAFYSFSETGDPSTGTTVAYDSIGKFNGIYGSAAQNAFNSIVGPQATADGLVGFPDSNTALGTVGTANSFVTLPAFNLGNGAGTNVLTISAWIYPNGIEPANTGIVFCRAGSTVAGLDFINAATGTLGYTWNNDSGTYNWNSGLVPPPNVWSMVSLVVTPTNATIYLCNIQNGLLSVTHVFNHVLQKFDGVTLIGEDSFGATRTFNGSIDEVALFGQALTQSQIAAWFSAGSGIAAFPPTFGANPAWTSPSIYIGQASSITVSSAGTAPLSYQWQAGTIGSGIYTDLADGGNISGATSATLTITNAQLTNSLDYVVRVSNAYGVTNTPPATLTVLAPGPAVNFTLNFGGTPVQIGIGGDWNNANVWYPGGLPAINSAYGNPGSSYEIVVGSRMRNPAGTTFNAFPGAKLVVDGDGIVENGTLNGVGEIRFKNSAAGSATNQFFFTTNYFPNLVMNGGELNIGDNTTVVLQGQVTIATNSIFYNSGNGVNESFQVDAYLTGSGNLQFYNYNATNLDTVSSVLDITGTTNTFTGQWDVEFGALVGSGINSLGDNTITVGTNGILETTYPLNNPNSRLNINGQMFLTQNDTFKFVLLNGTPLTAGVYSAATLSASYPSNFPATFPALYGASGATAASGQITVLTALIPPVITTQPVNIRALTNTTATFSATADGYPLAYQWYQINTVGVTNAVTDATNAFFTTGVVGDSDTGTGYFLVASNSGGTATSKVAYLTSGHMVAATGFVAEDEYYNAGTTAAGVLTVNLYPGSPFVATAPISKSLYPTAFDGAQAMPNNTGERIYGWFTPPVTGEYVFFVASDDASALWLSTDDTANTMYEIAQNQGWMNLHDWAFTNSAGTGELPFAAVTAEFRSDAFISSGGAGGQAYDAFIHGTFTPFPTFDYTSNGIPLVGGTKYFMELDHYQGGGGVNAAVNYKLVGNPDPISGSASLIAGTNVSGVVADSALPKTTPVIASTTVTESNVILKGTNGFLNAVYNVLTTTNLSLPTSNWTVSATRVFDSSGNFSTTNAIDPGTSRQFYWIQELP